MAAAIIFELKNVKIGFDEFVNNIDTQLTSYDFFRVADMPLLVYMSEKSGTLQLNKVLRLVKSHPDYRKFVKKCYNAVLRVS